MKISSLARIYIKKYNVFEFCETLTQECLEEIERVSSSLTKVMCSNPALGMQQR